jgi:hypothetical protein
LVHFIIALFDELVPIHSLKLTTPGADGNPRRSPISSSNTNHSQGRD